MTKGQMVAGSAEHADLAAQLEAPTTAGCSVNRLRIQVKPWSCTQTHSHG